MHTIESLYQIAPRYLRSTNLERDFGDPKALDSYVLTQHAQACLERLAVGLQPASTQRAWRLTGDYGSGKSSFALFLAHWFNDKAHQLSKTLGTNVNYDHFSLGRKPRYLPVLVTGSREPISIAMMRGLARLFPEMYRHGVPSLLQQRIEALASTRQRTRDEDIVDLIRLANEKFIRDGRGNGLLIILDELGKFLEHAAYYPESQDIYLLQRLAETAATSGKTAPLFVIGLLHQGFDAYAGSLDQSAQREWEKIAGRFDEILFNQPLTQICELIASALRVRQTSAPAFAREEAREGVEAALRLGWFGRAADRRQLINLAIQVYPIHGTVIPALVKAFNRFGQNERSLFSFLLSDEPFSLASFSGRMISPGSMYRLSDLYDYIRTNFGHRLVMQSYRSHWTQIESMVESFATSDALELAILKTIGLLNLIDSPDLLATEEAIVAALDGTAEYSNASIRHAIERLYKGKRVLFRRGLAQAFCLWPHTSVDLESALERATTAIGHVSDVGQQLPRFLETRPLVARRHYIETGNFRYFEVRYLPVDQVENVAAQTTTADGLVIVALCETKAECEKAEQISHSDLLSSKANILLAVPNEPLAQQAGLLAAVLRWEWVASNTEELNGDRFAREEVTRQVASARQLLQTRVQQLIGLRSLTRATGLKWFRAGQPQKIANARQLLQRISDQCDEIYSTAPHIKNELVNRRTLSSAAAAARMRLIERLLSDSDKPFLGMDPQKKPPEMSIYFSVLREAKIHIEKIRDSWILQIPNSANDPLNVRPCLTAIRSLLERQGDQRIKASDVLRHLAAPPFGVHAGLAPIFLTIYTALHHQELAFYEEGTFLSEVTGKEFLRLCKAPQSFELQLCRIKGLRAEVFESLLHVLKIPPTKQNDARILDVVKPLCVFVARLPDYVRNTKRLSDQARQVRDVILASREPVDLLFEDLPRACGMDRFPIHGECSFSDAMQFANRLKTLLDELRSGFFSLLERMRRSICAAFDIVDCSDELRVRLAARTESIAVLATESRLRALCLRFADHTSSDDAWLESIGNLLSLQPPSRWRDADEDTFESEIAELALRFKHLESIAFDQNAGRQFTEAFRISLTRSDGAEANQVVFLQKEQLQEVDAAAAQIQTLVDANRVVGLAALSRAFWTVLNGR
jgi:hypothetical protein